MNRLLLTTILCCIFLIGCKTTKKVVDNNGSSVQTSTVISKDSTVIHGRLKELTEVVTEEIITRKEIVTDSTTKRISVEPITITNRRIERYVVDIEQGVTSKNELQNMTLDSISIRNNTRKETEALDVIEGITEGFFKGIFGDVLKWVLVIFFAILLIILLPKKPKSDNVSS